MTIHDKKILILIDKKIALPIKAFRFLKMFIKEGVIKKQWQFVLRNHSVGGSIEIPRNLIHELKRQNVNFSLNDYQDNKFYDVVVVLKNLDACRWALEQKKRGYIKYLLVGPFISTLPSDNHSILETPLIDRLIFLCDWHRKIFYGLYGQRQIPSSIWYAGVDAERWQPLRNPQNKAKKYVLIYKKWPIPQLTNQIEAYFEMHQIPYKIIQCGAYKVSDYQSLLAGASMTLFIAHSETQGLAIFESWSMNVPTMHWDPEFMDYYGVHFPNSSSAPYLTDELGIKFKDFTGFERQFEKFYRQCVNMNPRKVILEKYTNTLSADLFRSVIENSIQS